MGIHERKLIEERAAEYLRFIDAEIRTDEDILGWITGHSTGRHEVDQAWKRKAQMILAERIRMKLTKH